MRPHLRLLLVAAALVHGAQWHVAAGEDPDPNPDDEDKDKMDDNTELLLVITGITVVTILFEKLKDYLMDSVSGEMHKVLESVFSELTVMGFIGLVIFTTDKAELLSKNATELVEKVHMIVFAIAVIFLVQIAMLITFSHSMSKTWQNSERLLTNDDTHGRIILIKSYVAAKQRLKKSLFGWLSPFRQNELREAQFNLEYHGIRDMFIAFDRIVGLHHSAVCYDHDRLQKVQEEAPHLVKEFQLCEYLHHLMTEMFVEFIEVSPLTWFTIYAMFSVFWLLVKYVDQFVVLMAFLTIPYLLIIGISIIIRKERSIRKDLVPTLMYKAAKSIELLENSHGDLDELTPLLQVSASRKQSGWELLRNRSRTGSLENPSVNTFQDVIDAAHTIEGFKSKETINIKYMDGKLFELPCKEYNFLKKFLKSHVGHLADATSVPFLMKRKHRNSFSSKRMSNWLTGASLIHPLNAHERLFWFGRHGPNFLMYLIGLVSVSNAVFLSVMATHWMPRVWSEEACADDFHIHENSAVNTKTFAIIVTFVGFLPTIVVCFRLYRALELFVIISYTGLNRIPEVMLKVIHTAKTRKSLSVLKLLSTVKSAMKQDTPPAVPQSRQPVVDFETVVQRSPSARRSTSAASSTFSLFDNDHSGSIDRAEFGQLLDLFGIAHTVEEVNAVWKQLDDDDSGDISKEEFLTWIDNITEAGLADLSTDEKISAFVDEIFSCIDVDSDGVVTAAELFNTLDKLGQDVTFDDVQIIMSDIDTDGSGGVDKEEFKALIKKNAAFI